MDRLENMDIELPLLLEAIHMKYGYDFRNYSRAHVKRRLAHRLRISQFESLSQIQDRALRDKAFFTELLNDLSINVTEMFRDPEFYLSFRKNVVPILQTYPFIKVWHAGCSTGEEAYSLAILLKEEGLLGRTQIYATDFNRRVLETAKQGIYPQEDINLFKRNYQLAGGQYNLSDYYTAKYGSVKFDQSLSRKIVFADHNLVVDDVFAEVNLILCRNVLIYFDRELQNKVISLFHRSLSPSGYMCLGTKESLKFTGYEEQFATIDAPFRIFKKKIG